MTDDTLSNTDNVLEATYSALRNKSTALGTSRDKSQNVSIASPKQLDEFERNILFRSSNLCRKVVLLYPYEASKHYYQINSKNDSFDKEAPEQYFSSLSTGSLKEKIVEASCEARLHGDAAVLLGLDDGQDWDQPVDLNRIKAVRWAEVLYSGEIIPDFSNGIFVSHYWITATLNGGILDKKSGIKTPKTLKVHKDRLLHFKGHKLFGSGLYDNAGKNDSVLQTLFNSYQAYMQAIMSSSAMIQDYNVFTYKLKGLSKLIIEGKEDVILQRFLNLQMGLSTVKGLVFDADNEDANFISRSFSGISDLTNQILDQMIADTDIPRFKLMNERSEIGFSSGKNSQEQRFEWASAVQSWQMDNWYKPLTYCVKLYLAMTKNENEIFDIEFPSIFEQSPLEIQEMRQKKAEEHKLNIELGIYTALEARLSTFGGTGWDAEITLNEDVTKKMEKDYFEPPVQKEVLPIDAEKLAIAKEPSDEKATSKIDSNPLEQYTQGEGRILSDSELDVIAEVSEIDVLEVVSKVLRDES